VGHKKKDHKESGGGLTRTGAKEQSKVTKKGKEKEKIYGGEGGGWGEIGKGKRETEIHGRGLKNRKTWVWGTRGLG